ncbi:MAG: DUF4417 domain-containing protein [Methanothrix sp.]
MSELSLADFNKLLLENFGFEIAIWPIEQFKGYIGNAKKHRRKDFDTMKEALEQTNFKDFVKYDPTTDTIIDGHRRVATASSMGKKELPVLIVRDLTPEKVKLLRLAYNRLPEQSTYDKHNLINTLADLKSAEIDYAFLDYSKYDQLIDAAVNKDIDLCLESSYGNRSTLGSLNYGDPLLASESEPLDLSRPSALPKTSVLIPPQKGQGERLSGMGLADTVFPSDPIEGIPILSLDFMATEAKTPWSKWQELSAKKSIGGTRHFYAYDKKLYNIWHNPYQLLEGTPAQFCEVNFSIRNTHGRAYALGQIYRKRQIARWLQSKGFPIFVDMNVGGKWAKENLIGVEEGWTAYCTRGYTDKALYIAEQIDLAVQRAGQNNILFVIYGGGEVIEDCAKESGCVWFPEIMDVQKGKGR